MVSLMRKPAWSEPKAIRGLGLVSGMLASCGDFNGLCNEPQSNASGLPREPALRTSLFLAGGVFKHAAWRVRASAPRRRLLTSCRRPLTGDRNTKTMLRFRASRSYTCAAVPKQQIHLTEAYVWQTPTETTP